MPPPVDLNTVPLLYPLVAALRLVCALTKSRPTLPETGVAAKLAVDCYEDTDLPQ